MSKPIVITVGEVAGIGPDIVLALARHTFTRPLVVITDKNMLQARAHLLKAAVNLPLYNPSSPSPFSVLHQPLNSPVTPGTLNSENSACVLKALDTAIAGCQTGEFSALVTGPVNKAILQTTHPNFIGHTEYLAEKCHAKEVVMMFTTPLGQRLVLVTRHIPLAKVSSALTAAKLEQTIRLVHEGLRTVFALDSPHLLITGLNPHAGENGTLGTEEVTLITPVIAHLKKQGLNITGPVSADTAFFVEKEQRADVIISMYHDQLLPAYKAISFGKLVNLTLGLPFLRTSVDHGTALSRAGTGTADASSLIEACNLAINLSN